MTPLKPSEKRLLIIFGTATFILLNLLGFSWYKKRSLVLQSQRIKLEDRVRELEFMKTQAPEAQVKRTYLDEHLQAYPDEAARETYLDQFVQKEAKDLNLEVRKNQPMPVKLDPLFHKSRYQADVSGEWDHVLEFIYRLQSPKAFRFVPSIRLKSQKKEGSTDAASEVVCTFEIEKWWSPESVMPEDVLAPENGVSPTAEPVAPMGSAAAPPGVNAPGEPTPPKTAATEQSQLPGVK